MRPCHNSFRLSTCGRLCLYGNDMSCFAGANEAETQASVARKSMTPQAQNDLFETEDAPVAFDSSFSSARRVAIDDRSWIEVVPGWVSGAAVLRLRLAQTVSWAQHD